MGTSTNQGSPRATPSWGAVRSLLGQTRVPVQLQSREIWRAAAADPEAAVEHNLANPFLALAAQIASQSSSAVEAADKFDNEVADAGAAGLMLDLGRRALMRAVAAGQGAAGFGAELFAETASYYLSRDLPSLVGAAGRVESSSQTMELKRQVQGIAREVASGGARMLEGEPDVRTQRWTGYVRTVLQGLQGGRRR